MLDGFNQGWIDFEFDQSTRLKGQVALQDVLQELAG
jgi:hypothetical protein